jgi:4-hydroxybenzoyl-CoA reductase subunit beta
MLRLPRFRYHAPRELSELTALLAELARRGESVKLIAGGTDLLPNMKHEIVTPVHVVSLQRVGLRGVRADERGLRIGAMTTLQEVADDPAVRAHLPALVEACTQIAGPQLRRMGTLGGNVLLDTRCRFVNQSYFWREALGFCLKKDGTVCHVVAKGRQCVAAACNDSVLPLLAYDARLRIVSASGEREIGIDDLFVSDGVKNNRLEADELLAEIRVPSPSPRLRCAFTKLRLRKSIDFPLLNLAVLVEADAAGGLERLDVLLGALGPKPKRIALGASIHGRRLDDALIAEVCKRVHASARPLTNVATDPEWRRAVLPVLVRRTLRRLAAGEG